MALLEEKVKETIGLCKSAFGLEASGKRYSQTKRTYMPSFRDRHEKLRDICKTNCIHSTYEFHHWLMDKGFLIVKDEKQQKI